MSKDGWIGSEQPEKNESREEQRRRMPEFMMAVMLLIAVFLVSRQAGLMVSGQAVAVGARRPVVVLDRSAWTEVWKRRSICRSHVA